jgi:alditol oxidase
MTREHNWADNYTFQAPRLHRPDSVDAVRRIVAAAPHVHAIGARHSFNGVADSPGDLIDLRGLDPAFAIDRERRTATMGAGMDYGALAAYLHREGWALFNMPSLPHVTIGGATATGTHGSGDARGTLSADVAGLEIVTAAGDLVTVRRGDANFDGMVVNLGALGVVTRLELDVQPAFKMRQDVFEGLPWDKVQTDLDAVMSAGYSVGILTAWSSPTIDRLWIKTVVADGVPPDVSAAHLGAHPATTWVPSDALNPFGVAGPSGERLPHFKRDVEPGQLGHLQSEYMLPRDRFVEAVAMLRAIGERIDRHLLVTEIRSMTADALWLSPAYGRATIALHFSWQREIEAVAGISAEIEAMLLPLGGRPHWGKIMHTGHQRLAPLYPRLQSFKDLVRAYDPDGKFANAFLRDHVIG